MNEALPFLLEHLYAFVFVTVLMDQLGLPLPAMPFLVTAGALARSGQVSLTTAFSVSLMAALVSLGIWYEAGRRGGRKVLALLCRIALEPDACIRRTENALGRHGPTALLIAPFVPGLGTVARPMAAMTGVRLTQFISYGLAGAAVWAAAFLALGYAFGDPLVALLARGAALGGRLVGGGALLASGYLGWKLLRRRWVMRQLRMARIHPEELRRRMQAGDRITIVDLRGPQDIRLDPRRIPGALRILPEELSRRYGEISRDGEVVLYCT